MLRPTLSCVCAVRLNAMNYFGVIFPNIVIAKVALLFFYMGCCIIDYIEASRGVCRWSVADDL